MSLDAYDGLGSPLALLGIEKKNMVGDLPTLEFTVCLGRQALSTSRSASKTKQESESNTTHLVLCTMHTRSISGAYESH